MASNAAKPTIAGQTNKVRKRNIQVTLDPVKFAKEYLPAQRNAVTIPASEVISEIEAMEKKNKLDFNSYGDVLFDCIIAGGIVSSGNEMSEDKDELCDYCVFKCPSNEVTKFVEISQVMIQRRPYLRAKLEECLNKLCLFVEHYSQDEFDNIAMYCGFLWARSPNYSTTFLATLKQTPRLVENGSALKFSTAFFRFFLQESRVEKLIQILKMSRIENLSELMPQKDRSPPSVLVTYLQTHGLNNLAEHQLQKNSSEVLNDIKSKIEEMFGEDMPLPTMIKSLQQLKKEKELQDFDIAKVSFDAIVNNIVWSKKIQLHAQQMLYQFQKFGPLMTPFCQNARSQIEIIVHLQFYCHNNINLYKHFGVFVHALYQLEVISETCIRIFAKGHPKLPTKGRNDFVKQLEPMIRWLDTVPEEDE